MWIATEKKPFTLRLPTNTRNNLKFLSAFKKRSQSSIASEILTEYTSIQFSKIKAIEEAKKQALKGAFISQEALELWVDSLGTNNELPLPQPDVFCK